jgi:hypothetical protein
MNCRIIANTEPVDTAIYRLKSQWSDAQSLMFANYSSLVGLIGDVATKRIERVTVVWRIPGCDQFPSRQSRNW